MHSFRDLDRGLFVLLLGAGAVTCGGEELSNPGPEPAAIAMVSGDAQTGQVGSQLADSLVVLVTDAQGDPVSGVTVTWAVQGGGTVSASSTVTGADGRTGVERTLGSQSGEQGTTASVTGVQGSPVTFRSSGISGPSLTISTQPPGSALTGEVWDPSTQPVVLVKDAGGNALPGVTVTAGIASGGGTLQGTVTATTGADGSAAFADLGVAGTGPHTLDFTAGAVTAASATITLAALPAEASTGKWDAPVDWDIVPLHMHLLPTGKILAWGKFESGTTMMANPRLWDPSAGPPTSAVEIPADTMVFCSGHAFLPDGRLMVSGGHKDDDRGLDVTNIFDPFSESWVAGLPKMAAGRWYPTVTTLPDGRVITVAGRDSSSSVVLIPEIWENNQWVQLSGASLSLPYYPRQFVAPNGRVFYAGERVRSRWLDVNAQTGNGRGQWTAGPLHIWPFNRDYGSAVMYEPGKILYVGGGGDLSWSTQDSTASEPTATAETIDLTTASPQWQSSDDMYFPRRHLNATILPDGQVLVTGGTSAGGFNTLSGAVHAAEIWNPQTGHWTQLASNAIDRAYHSVSLLLPDGTVLHGASGDANVPLSNPVQPYPRQTNHEIFRPPYLFKGARPAIASLPKSTVGYGETFTVTTANAAQITQVRWIRLGSVTHAFDQNQRGNVLSFTTSAGAISVTAPADANLAPPGHYLLFILNRNGVPSTGKIVKVQ